MRKLFLLLVLSVLSTEVSFGQCQTGPEPDPPFHGFTSVTEAHFSWENIPDGKGYALELKAPGQDWADAPSVEYIVNPFNIVGKIKNLQPATIYLTRVRFLVGCQTQDEGYQEYDVLSGERSFLTKPGLPVLNGAGCSSPNATSATFAWNAVSGTISGYLVDISANSNFTPYIAQNVSVGPDQTSYTRTGLTPGTRYYYQVRANNASGAAEVWQPINTIPVVITRPDKPVTAPATEIKATSIKANWNDNTGIVTSYRLDVAATETFNNPRIASDVTVNGTNLIIDGINPGTLALSPGTIYYYRVRAVNSFGVSENSIVRSVLTAPAIPTSFDVSNLTPSGFRLDWFAPPTADGYELFVALDQDFTNPLPSHNPKVLTTTNYTLADLTANTVYYLKLRARNAPNVFSEFATKTVATTAQGGNQLTLTNLVYSSVHTVDASEKISVQVNGGNTPVVTFFYKKVSDLAFQQQVVPLLNNRYELTLQDTWFDEFGMEFYIQARDLTNQNIRSETKQIINKTVGITVPLISFGREKKNYQIISMPYTFEGEQPSVRDFFEQVMGRYDKTKWRVAQYRNGENMDYDEGLSAERIKQGAGYWFITKNEKILSFGDGENYENSILEPFTINLKRGWNQIGNPFPFDLSWQDVRADNGNPSTIGNLTVFEEGIFQESDRLKKFSGGFVFSDEDVQLRFSVTLPRSENLSITTLSSGDDKDSSPTGWFIPLSVTQAGEHISTGGIGMHPHAKEGKDEYDRITVPRFSDYLEFNTQHTEYDHDFTRSIVSPETTYTWHYRIESSLAAPVELTWSAENVRELNAQLLLVDQSQQIVLDMGKISRYVANPDAKLAIRYAPVKDFTDDILTLGKAYPNPFTNEVIIPYQYSVDNATSAHLVIQDFTGKIIWDQNFIEQTPGLKTVSWNGLTSQGAAANAGMYLYKISVITGSGKRIMFNGKLVKE